MLDERKAAILRAVVEEYIETAQPVGSTPRRAAPVCGVLGDGAQRHGHPRARGLPPPAPHQRRAGAHREGLPVLRRPPGRPRPAPRAASPSRCARSSPRPTASWSQLLHRHHAGCSPTSRSTPRWSSRPPPSAATIRSVQLVGLDARHALLVVVLSNGTVDKHASSSATTSATSTSARPPPTCRPTWSARRWRRSPARSRRAAMRRSTPSWPTPWPRSARRRRAGAPALRRRHGADGLGVRRRRDRARRAVDPRAAVRGGHRAARHRRPRPPVAIGTETGRPAAGRLRAGGRRPTRSTASRPARSACSARRA